MNGRQLQNGDALDQKRLNWLLKCLEKVGCKANVDGEGRVWTWFKALPPFPGHRK